MKVYIVYIRYWTGNLLNVIGVFDSEEEALRIAKKNGHKNYTVWVEETTMNTENQAGNAGIYRIIGDKVEDLRGNVEKEAPSQIADEMDEEEFDPDREGLLDGPDGVPGNIW